METIPPRTAGSRSQCRCSSDVMEPQIYSVGRRDHGEIAAAWTFHAISSYILNILNNHTHQYVFA